MIKKTINSHKFVISKDSAGGIQKIELTWGELMDIGSLYLEHRMVHLLGLIKDDLYYPPENNNGD